MINVGIVGCGYVGAAMKSWLEENNKEANVLVSDPPKGYNDDLSEVDVAFVQINVPTEDDGTQDLTLMKNLIHKLPKVPVFVRTTILPGTSEKLSKDTGHDVYFMPEFLSERTHIEDFKEQTMVFTGALELLKKVFPGKKFIVMSPLEAELAKYIHNVFGAYKVTYFNAAKEYYKKFGNLDVANRYEATNGSAAKNNVRYTQFSVENIFKNTLLNTTTLTTPHA